MTTFHLMHRLEQARITLEADGDRLIARGELTPELRALIRQHKPAIQIALHLARIAAAWNLPGDLATELPDDELGATAKQVAGLPQERRDALLLGYLYALHDDQRRRRGDRLDDETAMVQCAHCGPVPTTPEIAAASINANGSPRVEGCPYCHLPVHCRPEVKP